MADETNTSITKQARENIHLKVSRRGESGVSFATRACFFL
jgi:hypothetical protein